MMMVDQTDLTEPPLIKQLFRQKLRIFDGQEGLRVYYGSGTTGDVVLGEQTTTWIGGSLWISFGNAGKYGIGGQFGTDDAGFALSWETI